MKLIFAVVNKDDVRELTGALVDAGHSATQLSSAGGFLRGDNKTLMIGVEDDKLDAVLAIIEEKSHSRVEAQPVVAFPDTYTIPIPLQVKVSGATVFVVDVAEFHKY